MEQEASASYKADKYALKASVNPAGKVCVICSRLNVEVDWLVLAVVPV